MAREIRVTAMIGVMVLAACGFSRPADSKEIPTMGIGLGGVSPYTSAWQFVDMMKYSREWRPPRGLDVIEDEYGWPVALKAKNGTRMTIAPGRMVRMWIYNRRIAGDVVLTWEGDGEVAISRREAKLIEDEYPDRKRRVYHWDDVSDGVFDLDVIRSNPNDHVRNIRIWMPGFENADSPFHPLFTKRLEPFAYYRFMDWGHTNNSEQKDWADRKTVRHMRQSGGTAYEYMIQLANETGKEPWICIPHLATDDYVRQLARLLETGLDPKLRVWIEYSNEIWNPAFKQTQWLWQKARDEGHSKGPWEWGADLCGRRSAQIWAIMEKELGDPDRLVRVLTHFRWIDRAVEAAKAPANGSGRLDVIGLNGYFVSQDALTYTLRSLDVFDLDRTFDDIEQLHLLGKATSWAKEIRHVKEKWELPVTCYEGGQHFANPFSSGLQGEALVKRMFDVNGSRRIQGVYKTAFETWHLAGAQGFTPFVDCGSWSKYGCWGHLRYQAQPLQDVVDPATGEVTEAGAHKYAVLLDIQRRWAERDPARAPRITTVSLPDPIARKPYRAVLQAEGGTPPYHWSLYGGKLPTGLTLNADGTITGTPASTERWVFIPDVADARGQHGSRILGLFQDPAADGFEYRAVPDDDGIPQGWKELERVPYLPVSARAQGYTVETRITATGGRNIHHRSGLGFNLTPDGDPEDYLRVAIDGFGHQVQAYSRYVAGSKGELWRPRTCDLLRDEGEGENDPAFDEGETWTVRATMRPANSPGAIDLLIGVFDEEGKSRLDSSDRNDAANGVFLLRELAIKDALRSGPFGLMATGVKVENVRWTFVGGIEE